jgi:catechol 2,3-dioxygenase-like lactoylglutathione lyase family enzyme
MLSDAEFLEQFDAGTLDLGTFDHEAHFRAAWLCLRSAPFKEAVSRLRRGLKRLAISAGQPQRYHETITVAYTRLIHRQMRLLNDPPWEEFKTRSAELLAPDIAALRALYGQDTLEAPESRKTFVPPPAWNIEPVERFLREFSAYQEDLDARPVDDPVADPPAGGWTGAERRAAEPVCVTAVLAVADVEQSARWYGDAFGFDVAPFPQRPPYQFALLSRGGAEMMLRAAPDPATIAPTPGWALYVRLSGGRIRELYASLSESCEIVRPLQRMPYHDVEFEVRDLDGYIVVVSEWLDAAGDIPDALGEDTGGDTA